MKKLTAAIQRFEVEHVSRNDSDHSFFQTGFSSGFGTESSEEQEAGTAKKLAAKLEHFKHVRMELETEFKKLSSKCVSLTLRKANETRSLLLSNAEAGDRAEVGGDSELRKKTALLDRSKDVTASLERMKRNLGRDLERINKTERVLKRDNEILTKTREKHSSYGSKSEKSTHLLKSIDRKQRRTKLLADIGFYIFCGALAVVLFKRIPPTFLDVIVSLILYSVKSVQDVFQNQEPSLPEIAVEMEDLPMGRGSMEAE